MADRPTEIEALRARLQRSRRQLSDSVEAVADRLALPARLRQEVSSHPWKWTVIALIAGAAASRLLPAAFGASRKLVGNRALRSVIATAVPIAARAGLAAWNARFPHAAPPPGDCEDEPSGDI